MTPHTMTNCAPDSDKQPVPRVERGEFASVDEMMTALCQSPDELRDYRQMAQDRVALDTLVATRIKRGLSQKDIAQRMECTQSRISKLEHGLDSTTSVGDLRAYAQAIGLDVALLFVRKQTKLADLVKVHTLMIRRAFDRMQALAATDESMKKGVQQLAINVFFENLKTTLNSLEIQLENGDEKLQLPAVPLRDSSVTVSVNGELHDLVYAS
jgi:transcriptional regulator with XRE-family HTH domain